VIFDEAKDDALAIRNTVEVCDGILTQCISNVGHLVNWWSEAVQRLAAIHGDTGRLVDLHEGVLVQRLIEKWMVVQTAFVAYRTKVNYWADMIQETVPGD